jgi:hypothetical protein
MAVFGGLIFVDCGLWLIFGNLWLGCKSEFKEPLELLDIEGNRVMAHP